MVEYQTHGTKETDALDAQPSFVPFNHKMSSIFLELHALNHTHPPPPHLPPSSQHNPRLEMVSKGGIEG